MFKRPQYQRTPKPPLVLGQPKASSTMSRSSDKVVAVEKEKPYRSEAYKRLVASYPCICCGIEGYSQCAHANFGRGLGQKVSDLETFPLCATRPGEIGCHARHDRLIGMTLEDRRAREVVYVEKMQADLIRDSWTDWRVRKRLTELGLVK